MRIAPAVSTFVALALSARAALAGDVDDTVFMKSGGRLRGQVLDESPTGGVHVRLPDGTVRALGSNEVERVQYGADEGGNAGVAPRFPAAPLTPTAPPPAGVVAPSVFADGTIHVEASGRGRIAIEGGDYGAAPKDVDHLAVGKHKVTFTFDDGQTMSRTVLVRGGATTPILFEETESMRAFGATPPLRFGVGVEGMFWYGLRGGLPQDFGRVGGYYVSLETSGDHVAPGLRGMGRLAYGLSPAVEVHVDAGVGFVATTYDSSEVVDGATRSAAYCSQHFCNAYTTTLRSVPVTARLDFQFNLGSVYAASVGIDAGMDILARQSEIASYVDSTQTTTTTTTTDTSVYAMLGAHVSPVTLRFGPDHEFSVAVKEGLYRILADDGFTVFEQTLSFGYLFGSTP